MAGERLRRHVVDAGRDSLLDALAALMTLFRVHTALFSGDVHHHLGHGKAEPLASLAWSALVAGAAIFVLVEATHHL